MSARLQLRSIQLTEARAWMRGIGIYGLAAFAAIAAVGYVLPAHRLLERDYDTIDPLPPFHSNYADGGPFSLVVLCAVVVTVLLLGRRGYGMGYAAGALAMIGSGLALAPLVFPHLLERIEVNDWESVLATGLAGLFVLGATVFLGEPVFYVLERRRIERAAEPAPLPTATLIR